MLWCNRRCFDVHFRSVVIQTQNHLKVLNARTQFSCLGTVPKSNSFFGNSFIYWLDWQYNTRLTAIRWNSGSRTLAFLSHERSCQGTATITNTWTYSPVRWISQSTYGWIASTFEAVSFSWRWNYLTQRVIWRSRCFAFCPFWSHKITWMMGVSVAHLWENPSKNLFNNPKTSA